MSRFKKILITVCLVILGILALSFGYFFFGIPKAAEKVDYGVTFSARTMRDYNLDPQEAFQEILDDLGVRKFRLIAFWDEIEKEKDMYNFADLDWQIEMASQKGAEIILALGQKAPRWPECHIPGWAQALPEKERQERLLEFIEKVITRYKENSQIKIWQVENEPFFFRSFGNCPKLDKKFFEREIQLVRELDTRPVMLTSSGEMSLWVGEYRRADIFGTSLYKYVYNRLVGYMKYRIPAIFYHRKIALLKFLFGERRVIVSEQQGEPWIHEGDIKTAPPETLAKTMTPEKFQEIIEYSKKCGFTEVYLWGVEWWYWLKTQGNNTYWKMARELFKKE